MGGRIECYVDVASFYSYIAFADLLPNLGKLAGHGVTVEFLPALIGGINNLSGNKPPWLLPAKAKYLKRDFHRASRRVSKTHLRAPRDLVSMAMTVSPLRALHFIQVNYPTETFLSALHFLFDKFWAPPNVNLTKDENLAEALTQATETPEGGRRLFTDEDVERIMKGRDGMKEKLKSVTGEAVERGAFGLPWFWVTDDQGKTEVFFGSDRFNHIYEYLGVPFQDVAILPASKL